MKLLIPSLSVLLMMPYTITQSDETTHSTAQLLQMIQQQQKQIQALQEKLLKNEQRLVDNDQKIEATVAIVEQNQAGTKHDRTHIGGYGELHYNNLQGSGGVSDYNNLDFHRFVLFFDHEFREDLRFVSEVEIEHAIAGNGQKGAVEVEQAYIEWDYLNNHRAQAGIMLMPVGFINETHEPNTFYGVERNPVEKNIIPTTWWSGGMALKGEVLPALSYYVLLHEGLYTTAKDQYKPRKGRQKTAKALASDWAFTSQLKWTGFRGVELALSWNHQQNIAQSTDPLAGSGNLIETHISYQYQKFAFRALYAKWFMNGTGPQAIGADEQYGWYLEPSWKLTPQTGIFARYNRYDNQAGSDSDSAKVQINFGINWWLDPNVVLKADYQIQRNANDQQRDGFNLGIGYQF